MHFHKTPKTYLCLLHPFQLSLRDTWCCGVAHQMPLMSCSHKGKLDCIIVYLSQRKLDYTLHFEAKRESHGKILQSTGDTESWRDYSKLTSNCNIHFCLLHLVRTPESSWGSASFLCYCGQKSTTHLEAAIQNNEICMKFNATSTYSSLFFRKTKFEHLPMNISAVMYIVHIFKTCSSSQSLLGLCLCPEYCQTSVLKTQRSGQSPLSVFTFPIYAVRK